MLACLCTLKVSACPENPQHVPGWVARVGSAGFLCVQILMLLDFVTAWNDAWVDKEDDR